MPFLDSYESGQETPNPDVMCNRFIKFNKFKHFAREKLGATTIATGHYAQTTIDSQSLRLLRGKDPRKDQSYFLSMTPVSTLVATTCYSPYRADCVWRYPNRPYCIVTRLPILPKSLLHYQLSKTDRLAD